MMRLLGFSAFAFAALAFADTPEDPRFDLALFSWQADDQAWYFALIPARYPEPWLTPSRASLIKLGPPFVVKGSDALKSWLSRLVSGSRTTWTIIWPDDAKHELQYPSSVVRDDIITFGKEHGLYIVVWSTPEE